MSRPVFGTLVRATWQETLRRPVPVVTLLLVCVTDVSTAFVTRELQSPALFLALICAAGCIGREVSSGVLALVFTRPVVRRTYVLAKWVAVSALAASLSAATLLLEALWLWRRGAGVPGTELAAALFDGTTLAFGIPAVLVFFSTLVSGMGDAGIWVILVALGQLAPKVMSLRAVEEYHALLQPELAWGPTFGASPVGWFGLFSYLSTVTLWLCLAVLSLNRKELSYASG